MRPRSPCWKTGKLCERHDVGCRNDCEEYQKYEEDLRRFREMMADATRKQRDLDWKKDGFRRK